MTEVELGDAKAAVTAWRCERAGSGQSQETRVVPMPMNAQWVPPCLSGPHGRPLRRHRDSPGIVGCDGGRLDDERGTPVFREPVIDGGESRR